MKVLIRARALATGNGLAAVVAAIVAGSHTASSASAVNAPPAAAAAMTLVPETIDPAARSLMIPWGDGPDDALAKARESAMNAFALYGFGPYRDARFGMSPEFLDSLIGARFESWNAAATAGERAGQFMVGVAQRQEVSMHFLAFPSAQATMLALATCTAFATPAWTQNGECPGNLDCVPEQIIEPFRPRPMYWGDNPSDALNVARQSLTKALEFFGSGDVPMSKGKWHRSIDDVHAESQAQNLHLWAVNQDVQALYHLGVAYLTGQGSFAHPQAPCIAARLLNAAARRKHSSAAAALAHLHYLGFGVEKNLDVAREYWRLTMTLMVARRRWEFELGVMGVLDRAISASAPETVNWLENARDRAAAPPSPDVDRTVDPLAFSRTQCEGFGADEGP
jgi:hypothetical protein